MVCESIVNPIAVNPASTKKVSSNSWFVLENLKKMRVSKTVHVSWVVNDVEQAFRGEA